MRAPGRAFRWCLMVALFALASEVPFAIAQQSSGFTLPEMYASLTVAANEAQNGAAANYQATPPAQGPLARLVANPNPTNGLPPFALTDQAGTIQRYVEPVPSIDLTAHVGQVVVVRHDTGRILLASQLELPPARLKPLVGERPATNGAEAVQQAQYADDDDSTVELLHEPATETPDEGMPELTPMADGNPYSEGQYPFAPGDPYSSEMGPMEGPPCCDLQYGPEMMEYAPGDPHGGQPCPKCGRYHPISGQHGNQAANPANCLYGAVEFNMLRTHVLENGPGKLSEMYEFSPRFILGFRELGPISGRARYWLYGRDTPRLAGGAIRVEFDVIDLEATHRIALQHSELMLAAGARWAHIELGDDDGAGAGADLRGLTVAGDGRTKLCGYRNGLISGVYGARLSILGGNWSGDATHDFVNQTYRDDNTVVHELYGGFEYATCYRGVNLNARAAFEMQNWHSDVLSDRADFGTIGFIGPGIRIGAEF